MSKFFRILLWTFLAIISIAAVIVGLTTYLLSASVLEYNEDYSVSGIEGPVEILRDASAIPHISAASSVDIYFGLGFVHAQDRLGQMLRARRAAQAYPPVPEASMLDPAVSNALEAYANGVNAWIREVAKGGRGRGAPELLLADGSIRQWKLSDSLAIARLFLTNLRLQEKPVGPQVFNEGLIPEDRPAAPELLSPHAAARLDAWALPANRTVSEAPIIAADATGSFSLPSQWYLADIQLPTGPVIGATLPGVPFVIVGRSKSVAWAFNSIAPPTRNASAARPESGSEVFLTALSRLQRASSAREAVDEVADLTLAELQVLAADSQVLVRWPESTVDQPTSARSLDFRDLRRSRLDERQSVFSTDGVIAVQQDSVSAAARLLLPLMAKELWFNATTVETEEKPVGELRTDVLNRLARWNGDMERLSPDPLVFWAWTRALQRRVLEDEFPRLKHLWTRPNPEFLYNVLTDRDGRAVWCDIRPSARRETCDELIRVALDDALDWLVTRHGPDPSKWYWGSEHAIVMEWSAIGSGGLIADIVALRASASGGPDTQKATLFSLWDEMPFDSRNGTNFQAVMSLAENDYSYFITPAGQSAHPLSRFYDNLFSRWMEGQYLIMTTDLSIAGSAAAGLSRLSPLP